MTDAAESDFDREVVDSVDFSEVAGPDGWVLVIGGDDVLVCGAASDVEDAGPDEPGSDSVADSESVTPSVADPESVTPSVAELVSLPSVADDESPEPDPEEDSVDWMVV